MIDYNEILERLDSIDFVKLTYKRRIKVEESLNNIKRYKETKDSRDYFKALSGGLYITKTIIIPLLQNQELNKLKSLISLIESVESPENNNG